MILNFILGDSRNDSSYPIRNTDSREINNFVIPVLGTPRRSLAAVLRRGLSIKDYTHPRGKGSGTVPIGQLCSHLNSNLLLSNSIISAS